MEVSNINQDKNLSLMILGELFKKYTFEIPAFQRNYVWSEDEVYDVISKLIRDVSNKERSTLGMITLYFANYTNNFLVEEASDSKDKSSNRLKKKMYVIDGQQRLITLSLLFQWLCTESEDIPLQVNFQRDIGIPNSMKRNCYIQKLGKQKSNQKAFSIDTRRFLKNFEKIGKINSLNEKGEIDKKEIMMNILENVKVLVHFSTTDPNAEFLNINARKNRFSLADYAKTYMMIASKGNIEVIKLFRELSSELYQNDQWKVLKRNYEGKIIKIQQVLKNGVENRLDILFIDRYEKNTIDSLINEDKTKQEFERLKIYLKMIKEMFASVNNYNSFIWISSSKRGLKKGFFSLLQCYNMYQNKSFSYVILNTIYLEDNNSKFCDKVNDFLNIQLQNDRVSNHEEFDNNDEYKIFSTKLAPNFGNKMQNISLFLDMLRENMAMLANMTNA